MQTTTCRVKGIHCASCAITIEKTLKKTAGVEKIEVNFATENAKITYDPSQTSIPALSQSIEPLGYTLHDSPSAIEMNMSEDEHKAHLGLNLTKEEKLKEQSVLYKQLLFTSPFVLLSIAMMIIDLLVRFNFMKELSPVIDSAIHHLLPIIATYMLFVVGKPYLLGLLRFFRHGKANMDTLIGLGTTSAFLYSLAISAFEESLEPFVDTANSYYDVTIVVIAFITLGKYLESRAKLKTGDAIEKLINLQAKTALVLKDGVEISVPIEKVEHDDVIIIKPGTRIPVDGIVIDGFSFVDESMITGEPIPVEKRMNDSVTAGTINTSGTFTFKATKVGSETLLAQIIKMVDSAQGSRAPIQAVADKISGVFVPIVLVIAFLSLFLWMVIGVPNLGFSMALSYGITSFVSVLIIACPCALGLATPTAIIVGIGKGAKNGILIKDAETLEKLHHVDTVIVDKTGTITKGKPEFIELQNFSNRSNDELIAILATLESKSEHPIAHAILTYAEQKKISLLALTAFNNIEGKGVTAEINGEKFTAGNTTLMSERKFTIDLDLLNKETSKGHTPIFLADEKTILGFVTVADTIKPESVQAIRDLQKLGISVVMLTGDNQKTAESIAREVGITSIHAEVLPQDKLRIIEELQTKNHIVAMAGDGINDAPALAKADIGIAMGNGSDIAIDTAGITLLNGDLSKLVKAISLSTLTIRGIRQNLFWAFIYNVVGIPLAAGLFFPIFGWLLNPIFAGFAMAFSSVSVVGNSLRLKQKKL